MMHVVAAPDKFRGTATAAQLATAVVAAAQRAGATAEAMPMADGGEGTLEVFGGANRTNVVTGPLGRPVEAAWRLDHGTAVIEMSQASGLSQAGGAKGNNPLEATTFGTGELINAAISRGANRIIVGVGGSATTDGGLGALKALYPTQRLRGIRVAVACDVRTRFVDAAEVFGPQKGANPSQIKMLHRRLERLRDVYLKDYGTDVSKLKGAGAAGGLAGGLACIGAELCNGFELLADEVDLFGRIEQADLVVTGEGSLDATSLQGKVVGGIAEMAKAAGVPLLTVVGRTRKDAVEQYQSEYGKPDQADTPECTQQYYGDLVSLSERYGMVKARAETINLVSQVVADYIG